MERRAERGWEANTSGPTDRQTTDRHAMWMEMRRVETCARAYAGDVFGFRLWVLSSSEDIYMEHCGEREYIEEDIRGSVGCGNSREGFLKAPRYSMSTPEDGYYIDSTCRECRAHLVHLMGLHAV